MAFTPAKFTILQPKHCSHRLSFKSRFTTSQTKLEFKLLEAIPSMWDCYSLENSLSNSKWSWDSFTCPLKIIQSFYQNMDRGQIFFQIFIVKQEFVYLLCSIICVVWIRLIWTKFQVSTVTWQKISKFSLSRWRKFLSINFGSCQPFYELFLTRPYYTLIIHLFIYFFFSERRHLFSRAWICLRDIALNESREPLNCY